MNFIRSVGSCCTPACDTTSVINTPGPQGPAGADGTNGVNGYSAYTSITADGPVQPAVLSTVTLDVGNNQWMVASLSSPQGMRICIGDPAATYMGYYRVVSLSGTTQVTLENLGYDGNAAPGTPYSIGMTVSPAGIKGLDAAGVHDTVALPSGVSTQAIAAPSGNFGFLPSAVIATILKPTGGITFSVNVHSLATTGFTADFTAIIPSSGYSIQYVAYS